uniref:Nitrite transporter n=1 Tax=Cucumis sativus TaxID=3659 RepID=A0A0A0K953_CUCSA
MATVTPSLSLSNEICEKIAVVGFNTNMISYLTKQLHMPSTKAANTITNFSGTASLTPLIGAFIADSYVGRFWTITVASILYQIGMVSLTTSAVVPGLRPPPCKAGEICKEATGGQLGILYVSLLLTALGSGGIRPCVVSFGADQFEEGDPKRGTKTYKYFNWYYFAMGASMLVAVTVLVYVQDNIGWGWGFGIPTIAMLVSIITFVVGYPIYRHLDPSGSPFTRLLQVGVAAYKKRKVCIVSDSNLLYQNRDIDDPISRDGNLLHTKHMRFLDKAAIVTEEEKVKMGEELGKPNLWKLSTVHRVEELKSVIRMGPIWASGIILITAYSQQYTFSLLQASTMNRHLTNSFQIPAGSMTVFTLLTMLITVALYDRVFIPIARRFTGLDRGITFLTRMGIGLVISIFATLIAGFVEQKRKHVAFTHGLIDHPTSIIPISVFWLVPQYSLHGMAEAFMSIGHLEFFYDQSPESMRSTAMALFWTSISAGNYLSTLLVSLVHKYSSGANGENWIRNDNISKGKLENFYWLVTGLQVLNLAYYIVCAKFYTFKPLEVQRKVVDSSKVDELQLVNPV